VRVVLAAASMLHQQRQDHACHSALLQAALPVVLAVDPVSHVRNVCSFFRGACVALR
jgi:hypothetical protein